MFYSFQDVEKYFKQRQQLGIKPGLERVLSLLAKIGHPERKMKGVHFAGTNGKGSTMQMVQSALLAHHYRVGVFTSPSFTDVTGHMFINGKAITKPRFHELFQDLLPHIQTLDDQEQQPTVFEILTVIAFMYFQENTDIVLIETGMGGRYDTTNCFVPLISVITSISYDHMQFLGDSIEEIAFHKAGIMKQNQPVVIGRISSKARKVMHDEAASISVPIYEYAKQFQLVNDQVLIPDKQLIFDIHGLSLQGYHQKENAAIALMVLTLLDDVGISLQWNNVITSIKKATLPGRLETIHQQPTVILDSAHNLAGVEALCETILGMDPLLEKRLLFAGFADKQLDTMIQRLQPLFDHITVTSFAHERAATKAVYDQHQHVGFTFNANWQEEVEEILRSQRETTYFITGSLHFITMVRQFILQQSQFHNCLK